MPHDDELCRIRLRLFALANELGSVRSACRILLVPPQLSAGDVSQCCAGGYMPCEPARAAAAQSPSRTPPRLEQHLMALALAYPGWGLDRLVTELRYPRWAGHRHRAQGICNVLRRGGLNTHPKRMGLIAGCQAPRSPAPRPGARPPHWRQRSQAMWCN